MKKSFLLIFLLVSFKIFADDNSISKVFEKCETGIIYIKQSLFFDSKDVKNKDIFKKLEKEYDIKILDEYINLGSGSGFFITSDGYIITNHHVIDNSMINDLKQKLQQEITKFLYSVPSRVLTYSERDKINDDFKNLISNSKLEYRIFVNNEDEYDAKVIESDKELDIALLKTEGSNFNALPLNKSNSLKIKSEKNFTELFQA